MPNPYSNRNRLEQNSSMFFGRVAEMRSIGDSLCKEYPESVSIIGERRIGKSSLAIRIFHKLKAEKDTLPVYLDFDEFAGYCNSQDEFFKQLSELFSKSVSQKPEIKNKIDMSCFENYPSFRGFVEKNASKGIKFVIFIDEFEHLPNNKFADKSFFSHLRAIADKPENRLAFVTISLRNLNELNHKSEEHLVYWNIFKTQTIGLWDNESIMQFRHKGFNENGFSLTHDEIEKIVYYAGSFPFFNQIVCEHIFDAKTSKSEIDWYKVEAELFPHFKNLWENRTEEEQRFLKKLKNNVKDDPHQMKTRGIVKKAGDVYRPFSEYFLSLSISILKSREHCRHLMR